LLLGDIKLKTLHKVTIKHKEALLKTIEYTNNSTKWPLILVNEVIVQLSKQHNIVVPFSLILKSCGVTKLENLSYYVAKELNAQ
jgi:hypothetical protein